MNLEIIERFKNREIKAKSIFSIKDIPKNECYDFIRKYHYLKDAKFFCVYGYGLFLDNELVGCATYSNPQGISALKGWFGVSNDDKTILELSRLCMLPILNGTNATSFLLGNSMKMLKLHDIKAVITLADSGRHIGSIYQVCNFKYYGLTDSKTDFFTSDGKVNPRGKTSNVDGVWLPRTRKHRYCYILDKELNVLYNEEAHPTIKGNINYDCCNGTKIVYDNRYNKFYTCPKCCDKIKQIFPQIIYSNLTDTPYAKELYKKEYVYILNNIDKSILSQNKFDCIATTKEAQDQIKPYKDNIQSMITYDFRVDPPKLWKRIKN